MLYDGALRHALAAKLAIERKDIRARRDAINRLLAIVSELHSTLDADRGGQIAESLNDLYAYMTTRIMDAATKNEIAALTEVERLLGTLRDAWQQVAAMPPSALVPGVEPSPTQRVR